MQLNICAVLNWIYRTIVNVKLRWFLVCLTPPLLSGHGLDPSGRVTQHLQNNRRQWQVTEGTVPMAHPRAQSPACPFGSDWTILSESQFPHPRNGCPCRLLHRVLRGQMNEWFALVCFVCYWTPRAYARPST